MKLKHLKQYKYSFFLYLLLALIVIFSTTQPTYQQFNNILENTKLTGFFYLLLALYISAFSFAPYFMAFSSIKNRKNSIIKCAKLSVYWIYLNILGKNGDNYVLKQFKASNYEKNNIFGTFRIMDYLTIIILMTVSLPFITMKIRFYYLAYFVILILLSFLIKGGWGYLPPRKHFIRYLLSSIFRYPLEALVPFALLYSFGFQVSIPIILFFTASTSALYYVPRFHLAGGLLSLYLVLYSYSLGKGALLGLVTATTLRLYSLALFVLPIIVARKINAHKSVT